MAEAGNRLRIRYGLRNDPSSSQAEQWARLVRELVRQGYSLEQAGDLAARRQFPDYRTHVYASEADTLDTLLRLAEEKK